MHSPDFQLTPTYNFRVFDDKENLVYKGIINSKAWSKSLETNEIWEYIPDNGRVIGKDFYPFKVDFDYVFLTDDYIDFHLKDLNKNEKQKSGTKSKSDKGSVLTELEKLIYQRKKDMPPNSYTTHLFEKGEEKILKKFGEEAIELILASKTNDEEIIHESADLLYHLLVYLSFKNIPFDLILEELKKRHEK
jgi:phosphoribosyl-ATP pyrophosphohydrolase